MSALEALDWALEYFVQNDDEFVVFSGVEEDILYASYFPHSPPVLLSRSFLPDSQTSCSAALVGIVRLGLVGGYTRTSRNGDKTGAVWYICASSYGE
ncbi:hypothetical protein K435DRAFT_193775 [Dendrothele bispora CBS 962.96]|uniref:Uncharacterized protein n=1 Tax=Dendrothele bispora (strain CBS 962.96) TaxID=1314807 RepID=A0A4S8LUR7_DENBC|nr:hypothetical protein K435DRAFT_193775 [Dendrothele bispora CBS 962.96]